MGESPFAISVQAIGTMMVAALLWQLTKLIPGGFLRYWSRAWFCLSVALFALRMTKARHIVDEFRPVGFSIYLLGEYLFGYLLWAGFRDYAHERPIAVRDWRVFAVLGPFALLLPWLLPEEWLLPLHTILMAGFFGAALVGSFAIVPRIERPSVGLTIVRVILLSLTAIFVIYGPLHAAGRYYETVESQYFRLSLIYYALIELGLAFGLVVLASEKAQERLEATNRELQEASRRDVLTGLYNRRHFDEAVAKQHGAAGGGALALIDVNDLKQINDTHLHSAGDATLKLVARSLVSRFRVTDPIFRIGGDEFAVLMVGGTESDLAARMADVDDSLMNLRVPGIAEPTDIRVAWGVASYSNGDALPAAFAAADRSMYACKQRRKGTGSSSRQL